jgi:hypothetical protein
MADSPSGGWMNHRNSHENGRDNGDHDQRSSSAEKSNKKGGGALNRAAEICQGRKLIEETAARLKTLERDHERLVERASLLTDAERAWSRMSSHRKNDHTTLLLAMQSDRIPSCFNWENFDHSFPQWIRQDREILLARLQYIPGFDEHYIHEAYYVPNRLRGDKEVMKEICARNSQALRYATKALKDDREVVMAAITQKFHFAPLALQHASPKLRGDRIVVRAALNREYGIRSFQYASAKLQADPKLAILAIRKSGDEYSASNEHLSDLPIDFREDEDVILEAVKHRGSNLRYVSDDSLLKDYDIIYQACSNDGAALEFVPDCPARRRILSSGNDLMMVLTRGGGQLLGEAPKEFKQEPAFILAAVENGFHSQSLGRFYTRDKAFFFQLIEASNNITEFYLALSESLQKKKDIINAVMKNGTVNDGLVLALVHRNAFVCKDKPLLLSAVRMGCPSFLRKPEVAHLVDDKTFVLDVLMIDGNAIDYASDRLQGDPDCVKAALASEDSITLDTICDKLPKSIWEQEELVEVIIRKFSHSEEVSQIRSRISMDLMRNRNIFLACMEQGWSGNTVPYSIRTAFENDEEIILASLRQSESSMAAACMYNNMGPLLQSNREFMEKAIRIDPRILAYASPSLRYDYDLMLLAIGSSRNALQCVSHRSNGESLAHLVEFATNIRERLAVADSFILNFLRGISSGPQPLLEVEEPPLKRARKSKKSRATKTPAAAAPASSQVHPAAGEQQCHLFMLDCGFETGMALKRLIAEFSDVPMGEEYRMLRDASENLTFWGY